MMPNTFLSYGTHIFWVMSDGNRVMSYENHKSKQPLIFHHLFYNIGQSQSLLEPSNIQHIFVFSMLSFHENILDNPDYEQISKS